MVCAVNLILGMLFLWALMLVPGIGEAFNIICWFSMAVWFVKDWRST